MASAASLSTILCELPCFGLTPPSTPPLDSKGNLYPVSSSFSANRFPQKNREDAATAEVSRSQLWQWVRHGVTTAEGRRVDKGYALKLLKETADGLAAKAPKGNKYHLAAQYFAGQVTGEDYAEFLTT